MDWLPDFGKVGAFLSILLHSTTMSSTTSRELRQHNDLTKACLQLTANELNVFYRVLALVRPDDGPGTSYRLHLTDMEKHTGQVWNYQQFKKTTTALRSKGVELLTSGGVLQVGLVASVTYHERKGHVDIELAEKIKPYLVGVNRCFTRFRLDSLLSLPGKYSKSLYLVLSQWRDKAATPFYNAEALRVTLAAATSYSKPSTLLAQVIRPALEQINLKTELAVEAELQGKGHRLRIRFCIVSRTTVASSTASQPVAGTVDAEQDRESDYQRLALAQLSKLNIVDDALVRQIIGTPDYLTALFRFTHGIQVGKIKAHSPGGLFLRTVGLR